MRALFLLALVSLTAQADDHRGRFERFCSRTDQGRTNRGFLCDSLAFFEAFPASGAGTFGACSTTPPTTTRGLPLIGKRQFTADCIKTNDITNIQPGDLVTLGDSVSVVTPGFGTSTQLGVFVWPQFVEDAIQTDALNNAAWTSTEAVTANTHDAPDGTTTADTLNDTSAGVQSCTSQSIITTSATQHGVSAYVRAGTIAKATLKMVGTGSSTGDCTSTSTTLGAGYTWMKCASPAAYAGTLTSVTVSLCVGTAASDVGTVVGWRVNHSTALDPQGVPPSLQATTGAVIRYGDFPYFRYTPTGIADGGVSFTVLTYGPSSSNAGMVSLEAGAAFKQSVISLPGSTPNGYVGGSNKASGTINAAGVWDVALDWSAAATRLTINGTTTSGSAGTPTGTDFVRIGNYSDAQVHGGVYKNIKVVTANDGVRVGWPGDSLSQFVPGFWMGSTGKFAANWSVSGSVIAQCIQQWRTYHTGQDTRVFFLCGVNDILNTGSGATAWAAYKAAVDEIAATGAEVVYSNLAPFGTYSGYTAAKETERLAFNAAMASWCSGHPTQKCVDLNTAMWDPANHTNLLPAYSGDGLHWNATGQAAAATAIAAVMP